MNTNEPKPLLQDDKEVRELFIRYWLSKLALKMRFPELSVETLDSIAKMTANACGATFEKTPTKPEKAYPKPDPAPKAPIQKAVVQKDPPKTEPVQLNLTLRAPEPPPEPAQVPGDPQPADFRATLARVLGDKVLGIDEIMEGLRTRGWTPKTGNLRSYLTYFLCHPEGYYERVGRGRYRAIKQAAEREGWGLREYIEYVATYQPMTYREYHDAILRAGCNVSAYKDPYGSVCSALARTPTVIRVGSGTYRKAAPDEIRRIETSTESVEEARKRTRQNHEDVTNGLRPAMRDALLTVIGDESIELGEIVERLEKQGWMPRNPHPRHLIAAAMSYYRGDFERIGRGQYRKRLPKTPAVE